MKMIKINKLKTKRSLVILGVILVSAVLAGGFWYVNDIKKQGSKLMKQEQEQEIVSKDEQLNNEGVNVFNVDSIDTSDWKTYRNEKYGFEVKYPSSWEYNAIDGITFEDIKKCERGEINEYGCKEYINFSKYNFSNTNVSTRSVFEWRAHDLRDSNIKNINNIVANIKNIDLEVIRIIEASESNKGKSNSHVYFFIDKEAGAWEITLHAVSDKTLKIQEIILNSIILF